MTPDPEYLEECVRRLIKASRAALNVLSPTGYHHADLAKAVAFARPHGDEAKAFPNPLALIELDQDRAVNPAHVSCVDFENSFYANGHTSRLVITLLGGQKVRVEDTSQYLGGTDIYKLKKRIEWTIAAGCQQ